MIEDPMQHDARTAPAPQGHDAETEAEQERLTELMADMYGGRGADPGTGDHTDAELTRSVRQGQEAGTSGQAGHLRATVEGGWATLEGAVQSPAEREQAVQAALEVDGIQGVDSHVHVTSTEQSGAGDPSDTGERGP
jgi:osmotically-inducible protein OsmY